MKATYSTLFRDGHVIVTRGTCAADAGMLALVKRDKQRGDRLAVVEKISPYYYCGDPAPVA